MTHAELHQYFASLSSLHVLINHSDRHPHFFRGEADEFLQGFRSKVSFPAVVLESSTSDYEFINVGNTHVTRTVAFMVVDKHQRDDWGEITEAIDRCERIGQDFMVRMRTSKAIKIDSCHSEPIYNAPLKYAGQRFEFTMHDNLVTCPTKNWKQ